MILFLARTIPVQYAESLMNIVLNYQGHKTFVDVPVSFHRLQINGLNIVCVILRSCFCLRKRKVPKDRTELATQKKNEDNKNRKRKKMKRVDGRTQGRGLDR